MNDRTKQMIGAVWLLIAGPIMCNAVETAPLVSEFRMDEGKCEIQLGEFPDHESRNVEVHLKNTTGADLILESVQSSCGCTVPQFETGRLPAGGESILKLIVTKAAVLEPTAFGVAVAVKTDDAIRLIQLKGKALPSLSISAKTIRGTAADWLQRKSAFPVRFQSLDGSALSGPWLEVPPDLKGEIVTSPAAPQEFIVRVDVPKAVLEHQEPVEGIVWVNFEGHGRKHRFPINVAIEGAARVHFDPKTVNAGIIRDTSPIRGQVTVTSPEMKSSFEVQGATSGSNDLSVTLEKEAAGKYRLKYDYHPPKVPGESAVRIPIEVATNDPQARRVVLYFSGARLSQESCCGGKQQK